MVDHVALLEQLPELFLLVQRPALSLGQCSVLGLSRPSAVMAISAAYFILSRAISSSASAKVGTRKRSVTTVAPTVSDMSTVNDCLGTWRPTSASQAKCGSQ